MDLIDSGLLQPGYDNMKVTYKGNTYAGALQGNGTILFRGTHELWRQQAAAALCQQQSAWHLPLITPYKAFTYELYWLRSHSHAACIKQSLWQILVYRSSL
jgi:hypothetical protein